MWKILGGITLLGASLLGHAAEPFHLIESQPEVAIVNMPCRGSHTFYCSLTFTDDHGNLIVRINTHTGKVTVGNPDHMNEEARRFWRAVELIFNTECKQ